MDMSQFTAGEYLAKTDFDVQGEDITVLGVKIEKIADNDRPIMGIKGHKPLVLNKTNINIMRSLFGDDSDAWKGQTVNLYLDPTVSFGGQVVGGLRIRMSQYTAPRAWIAPQAPQPADYVPGSDEEEDVKW